MPQEVVLDSCEYLGSLTVLYLVGLPENIIYRTLQDYFAYY